MTRLPDIITALSDPRLFGAAFSGPSWDNWKSVLRGAFGLPMNDEEREFFRTVAGREPPPGRVRELDIVAGRRSGKDSVMSAVGTLAAVTFRPDGRIRPGERPVVVLVAADRSQARGLLNYIKGYFDIPSLKSIVTRITQDTLELANGVDITVQTCDFRSIRGRTVLCAIFNETAFWSSEESANPDVEVFRAIQPALATLDGDSMLIMISSAYRRQGLLYSRWSKFYGTEDPNTLVIHAKTADLNPSISESVIQAALADDPESAKAEWLSLWRDDLASYIGRTEIEACVDKGITVRAPQSAISYQAFVDASSGAGKDSFCTSIGHRGDGETCIIDCAIEVRPPFNPPDAVAQIAATLKSYGITRVTADRWGLNFVATEFARHDITLEYSAKTSSEIFRQALPIIRSGRVRLVDNDRMVGQFSNLERRILPGGGERISHPERGGHHDDVAVTVAGCLVALSTVSSGGPETWIEYMRRRAAEEGVTITEGPNFGFEIAPAAPKNFKVEVPVGTSHVYLRDGSCLLVPADRIVTVPEADAQALGRRGWPRQRELGGLIV